MWLGAGWWPASNPLKDNSMVPTTDNPGSSSDVASVEPAEDVLQQQMPTVLVTPTDRRIEMEDHFSLRYETTSLRFRNKQMYVLQDNTTQLVLEERSTPDGKLHVVAKRASVSASGNVLLNGAYALVAALLVGFLFAFSTSMILHVFYGIIGHLAHPSTDSEFQAVATLLSLPVFVYALSSLLTIGVGLVLDVWGGFRYYRMFSPFSDIVDEWILFGAIIAIPAVVVSISLLMGQIDFYRHGLAAAFGSLFVIYIVYVIATVSEEMRVALSLVNKCDATVSVNTPLWKRIVCVMRRRLRFELSIYRRRLVADTEEVEHAGVVGVNSSNGSSGHFKADRTSGTGVASDVKVTKVSMRFWGRFNLRVGAAKLDQDTIFFTHNVDTEPIYTPAEAHDTMSFHTASSWSLGQLCCLSSERRYATHVVDGEGAITKRQWTNALYFVYVSCVLALLAIVGVLVFVDAPVGVIVVGLVLIAMGLSFYIADMREIYFEYVGQQKKKDAATELPSFVIREKMNEGHDSDGSASSGVPPRPDFTSTNPINDVDENENTKAVVMQWKTERMLRVNDRVCDILIFIMFITLFFLPLLALLFIDAIALALFFIVLSIVAASRFFSNLRSLLKEVGVAGVVANHRGVKHITPTLPTCNCTLYRAHRPLHTPTDPSDVNNGRGYDEFAQGQAHEHSRDCRYSCALKKRTWRRQTRIDMTVNNMTVHKLRRTLGVVFSFVAVTAVLMLAVVQLPDISADEPIDTVETINLKKSYYFLHNTSMPVAGAGLEYPTCGTNALPNVDRVKQSVRSLADFAFLSSLAYIKDSGVGIVAENDEGNQTQSYLDEWFGEDVAVLDKAAVSSFRTKIDSGSPVAYKLTVFPNDKLLVVAVRGTQTAFDMFVDMELWMSAIFLQVVRALLPFGSLCTPILPDLISVFTVLESASLKKVSYYIEVTQFVESIRAMYPAEDGWEVMLTGHSLGGGLAIVSGAQTSTRTVAFSAPNAILSRHAFDPALELDALNEYVFNVIPERDPFPMTDDPGRLRQHIECTASVTDVIGCHSVNRSMCELLYKCGADGRPIPCACVQKFGYDAPLDGSADSCPQNDE